MGALVDLGGYCTVFALTIGHLRQAERWLTSHSRSHYSSCDVGLSAGLSRGPVRDSTRLRSLRFWRPPRRSLPSSHTSFSADEPVPRHPHTAKAFVSDSNWYAINAYGGKVLMAYGIALFAFGLLARDSAPPPTSIWTPVFIVGPMLLVLPLLGSRSTRTRGASPSNGNSP